MLARRTMRTSLWRAYVLLSMTTLTLLLQAPVVAQDDIIRITGDRLSGFVLPVEPVEGEIRIRARRAHAWTIDDTKRLWLSGDVEISIAQFRFVSEEATVWMNRIPSAEGLINQIAVYFDDVVDPTRRAGMGATGSRLLVTGSTRGDVVLDVALFEERNAAQRPIVARGQERLASYLQSLVTAPPDLTSIPRVVEPPREDPIELIPGNAPPIDEVDAPSQIEAPPLDAPSAPLVVPDGLVSVSAGSVELQTGERENVVIAIGGLVVEYADERGQDSLSRLTLSAQRGVVYTRPGPISEIPSLALDASFVLGIYLEGNVIATDGEYTIRGSRVYYDFLRQQAVMLDGVLRTYERSLNRTIHARAEEFRQLSQNQWEADRATISTSEFFTPHLAIGSREVTITQQPREVRGETTTVTRIESDDNTLRVGGVPIFWWPHLEGEVGDVPLTSINMGVEDNKGFLVETTWDVFALSGVSAPPGIDLGLRLDGYSERGVGGGPILDYDINGDFKGTLELYGLYDSDGVDRTSSGRDVQADDEFRGITAWEHQSRLNTNLVVQAQATYISDETFVSAWREDDFEERREFETSLYLRNIDEHTAWTALLKYNVNDFLSNAWLLASRQYSVDRLPELTYRRLGDSLFDDSITYSSEYSVARVQFAFEENSPEELGIRARGFGIERDQQFDDVLFDRGLREEWVNRFDTRHEIAAPFSLGIFRVRPFLVGRLTAYDDSFDTFSSDSDDARFFGAGGLTVSTTVQRVYNNVESRVFDLHRLRHIIEPSVTLWYGYSTLDQAFLPTFDEGVESLGEGTAVRLGLRNTLQTQRGGPGFWHSVDFLTWDVGLVLTSEDTNLEHPVPQWFEFRPENSNLEDHVATVVSWLLSDTLSVVGESTYNIEDSVMARGSVGFLVQHNPDFSTFVEYRFIDASDTQLLGVRWEYQLTPKYAINVRPQWDFRSDDFRSLRVDFTRRFPDFDFRFGVERDDIQGETSLRAGVQLRQF